MNSSLAPARSRTAFAGLFSLVLMAALLAVAPGAAAGSAASPSLSVSVTQAGPDGAQIAVTGSGYSGEAPGVYVGVTEAGPINSSDATAYRGTVWVQPGQISGGSFDATLELSAEEVATLDPNASYEVHSQKAHGQSSADPSQNVRQAVDLSGVFPSDTGGDANDDSQNDDTAGTDDTAGNDGAAGADDTTGTDDATGTDGSTGADDATGTDGSAGNDDATGSTDDAVEAETPAVVQTDGFTANDNTSALALGGLLLAGISAGAVVMTRQRKGAHV